jgi:hypothetical protein
LQDSRACPDVPSLHTATEEEAVHIGHSGQSCVRMTAVEGVRETQEHSAERHALALVYRHRPDGGSRGVAAAVVAVAAVEAWQRDRTVGQ